MAFGLGDILKVASIVPGPHQVFTTIGAGLLGANSANRQANSGYNTGMAQAAAAQRMRQKMNDMRLAQFEANDRAGLYDSNATENLLRAESSNSLKNAQMSSASAARVMGYRPGDSEPIQGMNRMSQDAAIQLAAAIQQAKQQAGAARMSAVGSLGDGGASDSAQLGLNMAQIAASQRVDPSGLVASVSAGMSPQAQQQMSEFLKRIFTIRARGGTSAEPTPISDPSGVPIWLRGEGGDLSWLNNLNLL